MGGSEASARSMDAGLKAPAPPLPPRSWLYLWMWMVPLVLSLPGVGGHPGELTTQEQEGLWCLPTDSFRLVVIQMHSPLWVRH